MLMRPSLLAAVALLAGCSTAPAPVAPPKPDATKQEWYAQAVAQLANLNLEAERLFERGQADAAAAAITRGQPLASRLLSVPQPSLPATEAAADLDDLYGRMLLSNRHYGWARLAFQKNLARWKNWMPQTAESARRMQRAADQIADCDRRLAQ